MGTTRVSRCGAAVLRLRFKRCAPGRQAKASSRSARREQQPARARERGRQRRWHNCCDYPRRRRVRRRACREAVGARADGLPSAALGLKSASLGLRAPVRADVRGPSALGAQPPRGAVGGRASWPREARPAAAHPATGRSVWPAPARGACPGFGRERGPRRPTRRPCRRRACRRARPPRRLLCVSCSRAFLLMRARSSAAAAGAMASLPPLPRELRLVVDALSRAAAKPTTESLVLAFVVAVGVLVARTGRRHRARRQAAARAFRRPPPHNRASSAGDARLRARAAFSECASATPVAHELPPRPLVRAGAQRRADAPLRHLAHLPSPGQEPAAVRSARGAHP